MRDDLLKDLTRSLTHYSEQNEQHQKHYGYCDLDKYTMQLLAQTVLLLSERVDQLEKQCGNT